MYEESQNKIQIIMQKKLDGIICNEKPNPIQSSKPLHVLFIVHFLGKNVE
jgi:hypothetical protein